MYVLTILMVGVVVVMSTTTWIQVFRGEGMVDLSCLNVERNVPRTNCGSF